MKNNNTEWKVKDKASHPTYGVVSSNSKKVGGYDITGSKTIAGSIRFMFPKKPNWFHRMCCRFFLGWKWVEDK